MYVLLDNAGQNAPRAALIGIPSRTDMLFLTTYAFAMPATTSRRTSPIKRPQSRTSGTSSTLRNSQKRKQKNAPRTRPRRPRRAAVRALRRQKMAVTPRRGRQTVERLDQRHLSRRHQLLRLFSSQRRKRLTDLHLRCLHLLKRLLPGLCTFLRHHLAPRTDQPRRCRKTTPRALRLPLCRHL